MKLRRFLTCWWLLCFVVNMAIWCFTGRQIPLGLAIFSALMFVRSYSMDN